MDEFRPTEITVDLSAIEQNIACYKKILPPACEIMALVKADGYGHGANYVLHAALKAGATWAGVALTEEGIKLRHAGFSLPILVLGAFSAESLEFMVNYQMTPTVFSLESLKQVQEFGREKQQVVTVHLKVDTGMGRLGLSEEDLDYFLAHFADFTFVKVDGFMTHFASADHANKEFTLTQIARYKALKAKLLTKVAPKYFHLANSAGASDLDELEGNMVRIGIAMYGQPPSKELLKPLDLKEAISLTSVIIHLKKVLKGTSLGYGQSYFTERDSLIATVPIGYGDGYPRALSNKGRVLVNGEFAPIVGRVSMDMILIDVTDAGFVEIDSPVTLIGKSMSNVITTTEIAELCGTINYEITCGFTSRIPRRYKS